MRDRFLESFTCDYLKNNYYEYIHQYIACNHSAMRKLHVGFTHWSLVTPFDDIDLVIIGSGNGLLPDGAKPSHEPMLTYHY